MTKTATFRFYEELNDFLSPEKRKRLFPFEFSGKPSVKDAIEALGVPHTEVDLILVNSRPVNFKYNICNDDYISVYPVFESLDITSVTLLRSKGLRKLNFILDVHLGKLTAYLRMAGFDCFYENDNPGEDIIGIAAKEARTILTRNLGILKNGAVTRGYWIRSQDPKKQFEEVVKKFRLFSMFKPFSRCIRCNGLIIPVPKERVLHLLKEATKQYYQEFFHCSSCHRVYWKGSHYHRMKKFIESVLSTESINL